MADLRAGRIAVLMDASDDVAVTRELLRRHDPAGGRVVVHPTPGALGAGALAHDVLAALGRPVHHLRREKLLSPTQAWRAVAGWITGDGVQELIVLRAHRLGAEACTHLVDLVDRTSVALLLVCHASVLPPALRAAVHGTGHQVLTTLPAPAPPRSPQASSAPRSFGRLPKLPGGAVLHYRADVHRRHAPDVIVEVDRLYGYGLDAACRWLPHRNPQTDQPQPVVEQLQQFLTGLVHDSPTPQHSLAVLRGAQAGFLLHGHWLTVPAFRELSGPGVSSVPVTAAIADRITAGVAHPVLAAGIALALFTGVHLQSLRLLRVRGIAASAQIVVVPFRRYHGANGTSGPNSFLQSAAFHVPEPARPLLRAARAFCLARSPDLEQRLFEGISPMEKVLAETAARCRIGLPWAPAPLTDAWQMRMRCFRLGDPLHTTSTARSGPGRSCLTAVPPAPATAATVLYRDPSDDLRRRHSSMYAPAALPALLRAYLDGVEQPMPPQHSHEYTQEALHRSDLVAQHLAVRLPPTAGDFDRIAIHPDIPFALRLTDRPAAVDASEVAQLTTDEYRPWLVRELSAGLASAP